MAMEGKASNDLTSNHGVTYNADKTKKTVIISYFCINFSAIITFKIIPAFERYLEASHKKCLHITVCKKMAIIWDEQNNIKAMQVEDGKFKSETYLIENDL